MPRISRQTIAPYPFSTETLAESSWRALQVKLSNSVAVLRYLTSKLVYSRDTFSQVEAVTLFTAFEDIIKKVEIDRTFRSKYGPEVFTFRAIFQELDYLAKLDPRERQQILMERYSFYRGKLFSRRYYFAVEGQAQKLYETFIKHRYPKTFPPKTFVGKGYGDHGTAKNKAFDGSQPWQEVASDFEYQEENRQTERNVDYHRQFLVHSLQLVRSLGLSRENGKNQKV